jgi:hypothetical protein
VASGASTYKASRHRGIYREFAARLYRYYGDGYEESENATLTDGGYMYETDGGEKIFMDMIAAKPRIRLFVGHRLNKVLRLNALDVHIYSLA